MLGALYTALSWIGPASGAPGGDGVPPDWVLWASVPLVYSFKMYVDVIQSVAAARKEFGVSPPNTDGPPGFVRAMRVQANTVEYLVIFVPLLFSTAYFVNGPYAFLLGNWWCFSRSQYRAAYLEHEGKRAAPFYASARALRGLLGGLIVGLGVAGECFLLWWSIDHLLYFPFLARIFGVLMIRLLLQVRAGLSCFSSSSRTFRSLHQRGRNLIAVPVTSFFPAGASFPSPRRHARTRNVSAPGFARLSDRQQRIIGLAFLQHSVGLIRSKSVLSAVAKSVLLISVLSAESNKSRRRRKSITPARTQTEALSGGHTCRSQAL
jgi:glutathione S-transferase